MHALARELESRHYKFHVTSRGYRVVWRHYVLCDVSLFSDEGPTDPGEHIRLAASNFEKAVKLARDHWNSIITEGYISETGSHEVIGKSTS